MFFDINKQINSRNLFGDYVTVNDSQKKIINFFVSLPYASAQCKDVKSFVDDLSLGQGVVLSRVASTLRSIET